MDDRPDEAALALTKFGIGQSVKRSEDPTLVRGEGRYTDDINLPGQAYAVMVRSRDAHGIIRSIDTAAAKAMPGVLAVLTAADLKAYGGLKCTLPLKSRDGSPIRYTPRPALAGDKVRFVGDPVACVIAETIAQAKDAAEAVALDIEPLPAVISARDGAKPGAPQLWDDVPGNIALDYHHGDSEKVAAAFAKAAHVVRLPLVNQRLVVASMESRAAIGEFDAKDEKWTFHSCSQGVFGLKNMLRDILNAPADKLRVLTGNVGGSFGMKAAVFPEYVCILHGARLLGRPVKWTDERSGSFVSDHHGRDYDMTGEVAFDKDGMILAMRLTGYGNLGGYCPAFGPMLPTLNVTKNIISMYRTPLLEVATQCVFTNTVVVSAYRGAGRPEGAFNMERTMDFAAAELGIDRFELRRRNFIKAREMPFKAASGITYDCGDFPGLFKEALERADVKGFKQRKRESKRAGKLRGLGLACYVETTASMTIEQAALRFNADGTVTIVTGTLDYGQGHAATFAQVLTEKLGVPFERIRLLQGDSDELVTGGGTGGSRSAMLSGTAIAQASDKVIEIGKQIAAHVLEASAGDIEFDRRPLRHCRHRPRNRHHDAGRTAARRPAPAGGRADVARRDACHRAGARHLPERRSYRRGGDRSGHRSDAHGEIHRGQRFRHGDQSDAGGRPDPRRRGAGPGPGAAGGSGLRRRRPARCRLVHGLRHAARARCADDRSQQPSGADQAQSDRRQRLRRGRHVRRAADGRQCGDRRAVRLRHPGIANADDAARIWAAIEDGQKEPERISLSRPSC